MLSAEESLDHIRKAVDVLGQNPRGHGRAAVKALDHLLADWSRRDGEAMHGIDEDIVMAERIGQDLAELQRHVTDLQNDYMKALFRLSSEAEARG